MSTTRRSVTGRAGRVAVLALVLLVSVAGVGVTAASTPGTPVVPQQVGLTVTEFGGDVAVGGRVAGNATDTTGQAGAMGRFGASATAVLGGGEIAAAAAVNVSVRSDVDDVFGTAEARGQLDASVEGLNRTIDVVRNVSLLLREPTVQGIPVATIGPGTLDTPSLDRSTPARGMLIPAQTGALFDVSFWDLYGFMVNLLLGLILVGVFPVFSREVAAEVTRDAVRTGAIGLAVLVATPLVLLLFALSLFGIPLALVGALLFLTLSWIGAVYGRFAVGTWLLEEVPPRLEAVGIERPPIENRWAAILLGSVLVGVLIQIPYLGRVVDTVAVALGLGAIGRIVIRAYRRTERSGAAERPSQRVDTSSLVSDDE